MAARFTDEAWADRADKRPPGTPRGTRPRPAARTSDRPAHPGARGRGRPRGAPREGRARPGRGSWARCV